MESSILLFALSICGTCWVAWPTNTVQCPQTHVYAYSWFLCSMLYEIPKFHSILWQVWVCVVFFVWICGISASQYIVKGNLYMYKAESCQFWKSLFLLFKALFCVGQEIKVLSFGGLGVRSISRYCNPKGECVHAVNMLCCLILMCVGCVCFFNVFFINLDWVFSLSGFKIWWHQEYKLFWNWKLVSPRAQDP